MEVPQASAQSPFTLDPSTPGNVFCKYCQLSLKMGSSAAHAKSSAHVRLEEAANRANRVFEEKAATEKADRDRGGERNEPASKTKGPPSKRAKSAK
jgi:hypothetical protein